MFTFIDGFLKNAVVFACLVDKRTFFYSADKVVKKMKGHQFDLDYIEEHGFTQPVLVHEFHGLDLKVPPSSFTVNDVERLVGKCI